MGSYALLRHAAAIFIAWYGDRDPWVAGSSTLTETGVGTLRDAEPDSAPCCYGCYSFHELVSFVMDRTLQSTLHTDTTQFSIVARVAKAVHL